MKPLAHRHGITVLAMLLAAKGATCPDCGYGTRRTSKRWSACRREGCGRMKIPRRSWDEAEEIVRESLREERET